MKIRFEQQMLNENIACRESIGNNVVFIMCDWIGGSIVFPTGILFLLNRFKKKQESSKTKVSRKLLRLAILMYRKKPHPESNSNKVSVLVLLAQPPVLYIFLSSLMLSLL